MTSNPSDLSQLRDAFPFMVHHLGLLAGRAGVQLEIAAIAIGISLAVALPIGLWFGHLRRFSFLAINIPNVFRAVPSLALIAVLVGSPLGLSRWSLIVALIALAVPPIITNAYTAIAEVDDEIVDAARGMGLSPLQLLLGVELPLGTALLFAGIRTATTFVVATVPLGALAGTDGGLGDIIVNQASYRLSGVLAAAIWVAALALLVDGLFAVIQRLATPRALRPRTDYGAVHARTEGAGSPPIPAAV